MSSLSWRHGYLVIRVILVFSMASWRGVALVCIHPADQDRYPGLLGRVNRARHQLDSHLCASRPNDL